MIREPYLSVLHETHWVRSLKFKVVGLLREGGKHTVYKSGDEKSIHVPVIGKSMKILSGRSAAI